MSSAKSVTTRQRILEAAAEVMTELGLARTTTKAIARAAGLSEAGLYKHFENKEDLLLGVLHEVMPPLPGLMARLSERAGKQTVMANLEEVARVATGFYAGVFPMVASLFGEPQLLARFREGLHARGGGPDRAPKVVANYLRDEQRLGRVSQDASAEAAANLLLGACYLRAYLNNYLGDSAPEESDEQFAADLVRALCAGLIAAGTNPTQ